MQHEHLPALAALLYLPPALVLLVAAIEIAAGRGWRPAALALARSAAAGSSELGVAGLLLLTGTIHLGLVPGHLDQPGFAAAFAAAGLACFGVAGATVLVLPRWRAAATLLPAAILASYAVSCLAGWEEPDPLGAAAALIEVAALAIALRGARPRPHRLSATG